MFQQFPGPLKSLSQLLKRFQGLKSGGLTAAANLGINDRLLQKQGGWKSKKIKNRYAHKNVRALLSVSKTLGL